MQISSQSNISRMIYTLFMIFGLWLLSTGLIIKVEFHESVQRVYIVECLEELYHSLFWRRLFKGNVLLPEGTDKLSKAKGTTG